MKFLFFRASWCGPCNQMSPAVYELFDENVGVRENFTLEIVDVDEQPERAAKMGIRGLPTFVVTDDSGRERSRRIGAMPKRKLAEWLEMDFNSTLTLALNAPVAMLRSFTAEKCKLGGPWSDATDFRMTCPDTIYFDHDSTAITLSAAGDLYKQMDWFKRHPGCKLLIEGHCDGTGTREYNLMLGEKRAQAVKDFFASHMSMSDHEVAIASYGKERPMRYPEQDDSDRAMNRRAVTIIR